MAPFFPANPTAPGSGYEYGSMFVPPGFYPPGLEIQPDNRTGPESEEPGPSASGARSVEKSHEVEDAIDLLEDATRPLTCLWLDLLNKEAKVSSEDILLLIQRALVLFGSASHTVSQQRRKIAWSRINPQLKTLATEEYDKRESNLFGPGFLEKTTKRLEAEKASSKVTSQGRGGGPPPKRARFKNDRNHLRSFLSRGPPAQYGGRKVQCQQPYSSYTRFQSPKYRQWSKNVRNQSSPSKPKANQ